MEGKLHECLNQQDVLGRLKLIREGQSHPAPEVRSFARAVSVMGVAIDVQNGQLTELREKAKSTVTINTSSIQVGPGGVVGVDNSEEKKVDGSA